MTTDNELSAPPEDKDGVQAARAAAEARRRRILEQSDERMGVVGGGPTTKDEASKAARIHAMRRRRYGKKQTEKKQEDDTKDEGEPGKDEAEAEKEEPTRKEDASAEKSRDAAAAAAAATEEPTRKYQGVAKMRRKMLKEKQAKEKQRQKESADVADVPLAGPAVAPIPLVHVVFQALAVVLLFLAGLNVGMQHDPMEAVVVHRELSPRANGVGLLVQKVTAKPGMPLFEAEPEIVAHEEGLDEFSEEGAEEESPSKPYISDTSPKREPNIDPLFQVDLDELTSGPGLYMMAARGAVYLHRCNLYLFYYLPIAIFSALWQLPKMLISTPPVFLILALTIRQASQRLGGDVPVADDKQSKDVLAMLKNMVTSFLSGMFPTAVALYDVWVHLRSDMYVLMCGLFCGVALMHTTMGESVGKDEL